MPGEEPGSATRERAGLRDALASCSDVGRWTEEDARTWWTARAGRAGEARRQVAIREILDHLGLSPPEHPKPPPAVREVLSVPVDEEDREIEVA